MTQTGIAISLRKNAIPKKSAAPNGRKKQKPHRARRVGHGDIELGKRIRLRRVEQKMSQEVLGNALGVSFQQVQKYEKGVNRVSVMRLNEIARALAVEPSYFYDNNNGKAREVESLLFTDSAFSLKLLRAYITVDDLAVQRAFVALIETVAAVVARAKK